MITKGNRVQVRPDIETANIDWPGACVDRFHVLDNLDDETGTVVACTDFGGVAVVLVIWDGNAEAYEDHDEDGMPLVWGWLVPMAALVLAGGAA